jgi:hypothetical protein
MQMTAKDRAALFRDAINHILFIPMLGATEADGQCRLLDLLHSCDGVAGMYEALRQGLAQQKQLRQQAQGPAQAQQQQQQCKEEAVVGKEGEGKELSLPWLRPAVAAAETLKLLSQLAVNVVEEQWGGGECVA